MRSAPTSTCSSASRSIPPRRRSCATPLPAPTSWPPIPTAATCPGSARSPPPPARRRSVAEPAQRRLPTARSMGDVSRIIHGFNWPDRFVVGTVGRPGQRTFYLQARAGAQVVSVALEKEQSAVLAEQIDAILDELMATDGNRLSVPAQTPEGLVDNDGLDQPVAEQFRVGGMSLGGDPSTAQIVMQAGPIQAVGPEAR